MNKYPLILLLLTGPGFAHETSYTHFHEEPAPITSTDSTSPAYKRNPVPIYARVALHKTQKFDAKHTTSPAGLHKPTAFSGNLGYSLHPNFALEAGFILFGESDTFSSNGSINSTTETHARGITLGGRLEQKLSDNIYASLSAGLMFWHVETEVEQSFISFPGKSSSGSFHKDDHDPYWSVGLGYELAPNTIVKLNYNEYMQKDIFKNSVNDTDLEQSTLSLSIEIRPHGFF